MHFLSLESKENGRISITEQDEERKGIYQTDLMDPIQLNLRKSVKIKDKNDAKKVD